MDGISEGLDLVRKSGEEQLLSEREMALSRQSEGEGGLLTESLLGINEGLLLV